MYRFVRPKQVVRTVERRLYSLPLYLKGRERWSHFKLEHSAAPGSSLCKWCLAVMGARTQVLGQGLDLQGQGLDLQGQGLDIQSQGLENCP